MFLCGNFALKPLQTGEIMSNNKITQFSYFYWNTKEKKADEKTTLFHDETCHDCDIAWCFWKNASWDTIRSSSVLDLRSGGSLPASSPFGDNEHTHLCTRMETREWDALFGTPVSLRCIDQIQIQTFCFALFQEVTTKITNYTLQKKERMKQQIA